MTKQDIINLRLSNLQISSTIFSKPEDLVAYLGAVQSQDFAGAKWALGLRLHGSTNADIEKPFNEGKILRTHLLRPTWHFIVPEYIRWLLMLTAPQIKRLMAHYDRQLELDEVIFKKAREIFEKSLKGGGNLTRTELTSELKKHRISGTGQRINHIVMQAELDGLICSGPKKGKQFTYALIEERVPKVEKISRDEALAKLTKLFFTTRGPATIKDFSKWSGLTRVDINRGIGMVTPTLFEETLDGKTYYFAHSTNLPRQKSPTAYLLPNYDEFVSGFSDYSLIADLSKAKNLNTARNPVFWNHLVIDGQIEGSWRRILKKDQIEIELAPFRDFTSAETNAIENAADDYRKFLGMKVQIN